MHRKPTLKDQVEASLKMLGLRPVVPAEGAAHLNGYGLADPQGHAWTPETLAAYLEKHNIRPEVLPDLSHFEFAVPDREWNGRAILRAIERGPDETEDRLRRAIRDDPDVRRAVVRLCSTVNDNPYDPGLYARWLDFARRHD